ncbi:MAG: hypothetical protein VXZ31_08240, partial [Pseudomonadota bacterium]|nr:hypothetical protein [Pseudomonadota bacterium]MEC9190908.1 hypothetical protein [Pseudomonadota bacterium]
MMLNHTMIKSLVLAAAGAFMPGAFGQSDNAFGIPSEKVRNPAANIVAAPGSRGQGWLAQGRSEVIARHGIVATSDPLAAQAGLEIL